MATLSGYFGRVTWGTYYTEHAYSWSMDAEAEALENTAWEFDGAGNPISGTGSDGWKTFQVGLIGFSGSFTCRADSEEMPDIKQGDLLDLSLYHKQSDANHYWKGKAFCTGAHSTVPIEGLCDVTIDFQGSLKLIHSGE